MNTETMKAVICTKYGPPEVLKITRVAKPVARNNQVLVKVMAASVNSGDVRVRGLAVSGVMKFVMRLVLGFTGPRKQVLGTVFSGIVEQVGKDVKEFKVGDKVYGLTGLNFGAFAQYIAVAKDSVVVKMPANATFEEAAAIPFGGQTAIYFFEKAKIAGKAKPKVLIYGATGSVGTAAIQIAQYYNADITAVCSSKGKPVVHALGVQNVVLYDSEDFTNIPSQFDLVFDAVGKTTKTQCKPLLNEKGIYLTVGGLDVASESKAQLELIRRLFEEGRYKATIDKVYTLDEVVEANRYVDTGHKKGNVVLKIA